MIGASLRHVVTAILGRRPCDMPWCGRAVRAYGYCIRHLHSYRYGGA